MHGFEVCRVFLYDLFETSPLFDHVSVLSAAGSVVLLYELVELMVEKLDFLLGLVVYFVVPLHLF